MSIHYMFAKKGKKFNNFTCYHAPVKIVEKMVKSGKVEQDYKKWVMNQEWLKENKLSHLTKCEKWLSAHKGWHISVVGF